MTQDPEIPGIQFTEFGPAASYYGLNPNAAGYRKHAVLHQSILFIACMAVAGLAGMLSFAGRAAPSTGFAVVGICAATLVVGRWLLLRRKFCPICGACTRRWWATRVLAWCPGCQNLNDPKQVLAGDADLIALNEPQNLGHCHAIPRFVAVTTLLAIREGASELRHEVTEDEYQVTIMCGDEAYQLVPPPKSIHFAAVQTIKAIAGLDLANCHEAQQGHVNFRVDNQIIGTRVLVRPSGAGQEVVFRW